MGAWRPAKGELRGAGERNSEEKTGAVELSGMAIMMAAKGNKATNGRGDGLGLAQRSTSDGFRIDGDDKRRAEENV